MARKHLTADDLTDYQKAIVHAHIKYDGELAKIVKAIPELRDKNNPQVNVGQILQKPHVRQYLLRLAAEEFAKDAHVAVNALKKLAKTAKSEKVRLDAILAWLNRAGISEPEPAKASSGAVTINIGQAKDKPVRDIDAQVIDDKDNSEKE